MPTIGILTKALASLTMGGLAGGVAVVGVVHHATAPGPGIVTTATVTAACPADRLPTRLRQDLAALRDLPAGQRVGAVADIRARALSGGYGARVQHGAQRRVERRAGVWLRLPDALRSDLLHAQALPATQRPAAYDRIRSDALSGQYGDEVQRFAQRRQALRETCAPNAS